MPTRLPRIGFGLPVAGSWATLTTICDVARCAEVLGYASLWTFQRTLWPVDGRLGPAHRSVLDPVVTLALAAGHTSTIGLGTATLCAPFTAPAMLAKTVASLDVVSNGRLTLGIGIGWLPEEYTAAGVSMQRRGARMEEYLRCLHALLTEDPAEFTGEFYVVPPSHLAPPPMQRPRPPILLGGTAAPALRRAGRLAEGWIGSSQHDLAQVSRDIALVRDGARQAGRDPEAVQIVVRGVVDLVDRDPDARRRPLRGTRTQVLDDLDALAAQGVTEVFLDLNLSPRMHDPEVSPPEALAYAEEVLDAFAPGQG